MLGVCGGQTVLVCVGGSDCASVCEGGQTVLRCVEGQSMLDCASMAKAITAL